METMRASKQRRRKSGRMGCVLFLFALALVTAGGVMAWQLFVPSREKVEPVYEMSHPIIYRGEALAFGALVEGDAVKLPLEAITKLLGSDEFVHYEADSDSIIITTRDKVVHLKTEALTATMNQQPYELHFAAEKQEDIVYLPMRPLEELFGLQAIVYADSPIVTIRQAGDVVQRAISTVEQAKIRQEPTIKAPYVQAIASGAKVDIWSEHDGWYYVQGPAGYTGFMKKSDVVLSGIEKVDELPQAEPFIAWEVYGQKVNLTWEAVYCCNPDPAKIAPMPGVNVVSPTWFELEDDSGTIRSKADAGYVSWAHKQGIQVWGLFSNSFEPDRTTAALSTYESRWKMTKQLLAFAQTYKLQGINIDFENVHTKDKENLVQFVREMTPLLHEQGLVVSIDVTPKSNSEMWSAFLDREALGKVVDFMMVMAYDEHWAASPKAGSVASLPWVENSIKRILDEDNVPASKLLLGIPLYTRIWTETKGEDGTVKVSSKAIGMETAESIIRDKKLTPVFKPEAGQNYVEYTENGALQRIWLEDEVSIEARAALVRKYDLGGVATWQRAFKKDSIWSVLDNTLKQLP